MSDIDIDTMKVQKGGLINKIVSVESGKFDVDGVDNNVDGSEKEQLLRPRKGGMSRKGNKMPRKVQWNDRHGHSLVEVLEFQPSDHSDSDDEDHDSCICIIM